MKQYDSYKDSGIEWLGMIPSHWELSKGKHMFSLITDNVSDPSLPKVALENIESGTGHFIETESDFMGEGVEFRENDILFGKLRPYLAKVYKAEFRGQSVGDIYVFRGNGNQDADFLKFLMLSHPFISVVDGSTYGAKMPRANWDFISHMILPNPPIAEQHIIGNYLVSKVSQIDAIISEKERMVEDLQNYRMSILTETVTHGLNPDIKMKDSGIDWIGMMPEHWKIVKTSFVFNEIGSGTTPNTNNESYYVKEGINWLQTGDLNDSYINETSKHISEKAFKEHSVLHIYPKGSLVIAMYGATIGKLGILNIEAATNQACCVLAKSNSMLIKYAYYVFAASKQSLVNLAYGGGQPNISQTVIRNHKLPVPPIDEQKTIIAFLDSQVQGLDSSISELHAQIEDLKSYKSSLITEAVTGKIDLR